MPSCYVCGRTRNQKTKTENISFHKCPVKNKFVRDKWQNFVLENKSNVQNFNQYSVICSKHFVQACFVMRNNKTFLVKNAVPTIIISRIKGARNLYSEKVKHLNVSFLCPDNEPKSSFDIIQTLVKVNGDESISKNIDFPNTNTSINIGELKDQISISVNAVNECEVSPLTPNHSSLNISKKVSATINVENINECGKNSISSFVAASEFGSCNTPRRLFLKSSPS
ncbi:THAP domain-containing protein 1-like [Aphis craccivora]|uniref:THAP domain-containing protein 1-like n=1 Tax=Aphis craccivora TaxID=307492 RepID=A0A6G0YU26_APHCR|nr:THAP domain-containing protein 1-like [Aphis craccivora]